MKFTTTTIVALATLFQTVFADSRQLSVVSAHSASAVHLLPLHDAGEGLLLGKGDGSVGLTITDKGTVKFSNGKYAVVDSDGYLVDGDEDKAVTGWTIKEGTLYLNDNAVFYAVPTSDATNYKVSTENVADSTYIHFIGATSDANRSYTYIPGGDDSASAPSNSTTTATTTTVAPKTTATVEQAENLGNKLGLGLSVGLAGVAALLL